MGNFRILKPVRRRNLIWNPSAEGSAGYGGTTATIARSTAYSHWGRYSYSVTPTSSTGTLDLTMDAAPGATCVMSCWATSGEPLAFLAGSANVQPVRVATDGIWSLYEAALPGSAISGATTASIKANRVMYIDDVQFEAGSARSSSLNGAMGFGYRWLGAAHGSASERLRYHRRRLVASGGIETVLDDDERVRVKLAYGVGVPPVNIQTLTRQGQDGNVQVDRTLDARAIRLTIWLEGDDFDDLLALRRSLISMLVPKDEIRLISSLGGVAQYIDCAYQSGLELGNVTGSLEPITLNLMAGSPEWTATTQVVYPLTLSSTFTANKASMRQFGQWQNMGTPPANVLKWYRDGDGTLYGATDSDSTYGWVVRWDSGTWTKLARVSGGSARVNDVKRHPNGTLYFCGSFTAVQKGDGTGSVTTSNIATFDGSVVAAIGGMNNTGNALDFSPDYATLYVTGLMTQAGGSVSVNRIAAYSIGGATWAALGQGLEAEGTSLRVNKIGLVYVGGKFAAAGRGSGALTLSGGTSGSLPYSWYFLGGYFAYGQYPPITIQVTAEDASNNEIGWSNTYSTTTSGFSTVNLSWTTMTCDHYCVYVTNSRYGKGRIYRGSNTSYNWTVAAIGNTLKPAGPKPTAGSAQTPKVGVWNPTYSAWTAAGVSGFNGDVLDLWLDDDQVTLLASGAFSTADGNLCNGVAYFNGATWNALGIGAAAGSTLYGAIRASDGSVWAVGSAASFFGDSLAVGIGRWIGSLQSGAWVHTDLSLPGGVTVYCIAEVNGDIVIGHNANGTATTSGHNTLAWAGDMPGYPVIYLTGPGKPYTISSEEAGAALHFNGYTLQAGEEMIVDLSPGAKTVRNNRVPNLTNVLRPGSQMDLCLLPGGDNSFSLMMTGTTGSSDCRMVLYPKNMSVDN